MEKYNWTIVGLVLSGIFSLIGIIFLSLKEKACGLIAGYNTKTKEEREEYDEERLSKDERNFFFISAIIYLIGAILSIFGQAVCFWAAFFVWAVFFLKNLHLDGEKAFEKYKK